MKIAYIYGGPGVEHAISVAGAKFAIPQFASSHTLLPVFISLNEQWSLASDWAPPKEAAKRLDSLLTASAVTKQQGLARLAESAPDIVFIGIHGEYGEDGQIQDDLSGCHFHFTGSDADAARLAIDKPRVLTLLQNEGIAVPEFLEVDNLNDAEQFAQFVGYPVFVLPANRGSSVGVTRVESSLQLAPALDAAKSVSPRVMVSQAVSGREISCGVYSSDAGGLTALPITEVYPKGNHAFFDFDAKYKPGESREVTPANVTPAQVEAIQTAAKRVHQLVGADGISRVDMILREATPVVLEINTIPGLTSASIIPQQAAAAGIEMSRLLDIICQAGLTRDRQREATRQS